MRDDDDNTVGDYTSDELDIYGLEAEVYKALVKMTHENHFVSYLSEDERNLLRKSPSSRSGMKKLFKKEYQGYPVSPLCLHLANFLTLMMTEGTCPVMKTPVSSFFDEGEYAKQRVINLNMVREELKGALTLWRYWGKAERAKKLAHVFQKLRRNGLLDLLQLRCTFGTVRALPIPQHLLIEACQKPHCDVDKDGLEEDDAQRSSTLTVCGRAFTKHCVRDSSNWWGSCTGNDRQKNDHAMSLVRSILSEAVWINIHQLPGKVPTLEIRNQEGYGIRFDYEPVRFRGFIEPHQAEGWLNKYKH